jgi:hypothetical protein
MLPGRCFWELSDRRLQRDIEGSDEVMTIPNRLRVVRRMEVISSLQLSLHVPLSPSFLFFGIDFKKRAGNR